MNPLRNLRQALAAFCLGLMASQAMAAACPLSLDVLIHAEVVGFDPYPGITPEVTGLGTSKVAYGRPFSPTTPTSTLEFQPSRWQVCDPASLFDPFWALTVRSYNGATAPLVLPDGTLGPTWPIALRVQVTATNCRFDSALGPLAPCEPLQDLAGGEFWMSLFVTPNDPANSVLSADAACAPTFDLICAYNFEGNEFTYGLFGYFGSFHPTGLVPLDRGGFVTLGTDFSAPLVFAVPEPGTATLALLAALATALRVRRGHGAHRVRRSPAD